MPDTPEEYFTQSADDVSEFPVDAIQCAVARAESVLILLSVVQRGDCDTPADHIIENALWNVRGQLEQIGKMTTHYYHQQKD